MADSIDKTKLNSNLRYRFEYLSNFLHFTDDDIRLLNQFALILIPRIPFVTEHVYQKLLTFDITKKFFLIRNDGFEGHLTKSSAFLNLNSPQITYRRDMLSLYLKQILSEKDWSDSFLEFLSQVGKMHTDQTGSKSINVDYIHINALFNYLEHLLLDIVWTNEELDMKTKGSMCMAINKLFWIQNDFFTMHYLTSWHDENNASNVFIKPKHHCCF